MTTAEHFNHNADASPSYAELLATLGLVNQQLERADENENIIEREQQRDMLLEERDWLEEEIHTTPPASE